MLKPTDRRARVRPVTNPVAEDAKVVDFLVLVGERVRTARARKGISRRVLSEKSGVSQRYLAQLESGSGNVSIGLLLRIAEALDFGVEKLVRKDDPVASRMTALLARATDEQRRQVFQILAPDRAERGKNSRIALIGLRGAGKSTLGRKCAAARDLPFLELNSEVEQDGGIPVQEIIALYGLEGYRQRERQAVERVVASHDAVVLAVAGGIVSQPGTFDYLLRYFHTLWLRAEPEEHMQRVLAQGDERPMAGNPDAMNELRNILASREALYSRADAQVNTSHATVDESLAEVLRQFEENGFLPG